MNNKNTGRPNMGRQQSSRNDSKSTSQPIGTCDAPYNFVPVVPELTVQDSPVLHDQFRSDDDYFTGTLFVEICALTPLAAMSQQSLLVESSSHAAFEEHFIRPNERHLFGDKKLDKDKKLLEPLTLVAQSAQSPGPVLISGATLKGALRAGIQALLSAPIERVQEQKFSFRPNLDNAERCVPSIVNTASFMNGKLTGMSISRLDIMRGDPKNLMNHVIYVDPDVEDNLLDACRSKLGKPSLKSLDEISWDDRKQGFEEIEIRGAFKSPGRLRRDLKTANSNEANTLRNVVLLRHRSGVDGAGTLQSAFEEQHPNEDMKRVYRWVLLEVGKLPYSTPSSAPDELAKKVIPQFVKTQELLCDEQIGHMKNHPLKKSLDVAQFKQNLLEADWPKAGDIVFFDLGGNGRLVGMGTHFRHRRGYRDSIQLSCEPKIAEGASFGKNNLNPQLRNLLRPTQLEQTDRGGKNAGVPEKLSAARCLFGYVASGQKGDTKGAYDPDRPNEAMTHGIGSGDGAQLAGRIAFNFAVERPRDDGKERFINEKYGCLVPLRVLGGPKPSAVEMYLTQDGVKQKKDAGWLCTFGDHSDDESVGNLRGRKFYYHQPEAAKTKTVYQLDHRDRLHWQEGDEGEPHLLTKQSVVAKHVLAPGARLRYAMRLSSVRQWELGAIFLALECRLADVQQICQSLGDISKSPRVLELLNALGNSIKSSSDISAFAIHLGHGRPLGLGSVTCSVTACEKIMLSDFKVSKNSEDVSWIREMAIDALAAFLRSSPAFNVDRWLRSVFFPWLKMHQFNGAKSHRDYPRDPKTRTIFDYHSNVRRTHSKGRKEDKTLREEKGVDNRKVAGLESLIDTQDTFEGK